MIKYSSVFRENRCPPPPKPVYGGNFSHETVTLKIRSRLPKSKNRSNLGEVDVAPAKNDKVNKVEKVIKINSRIISKPYAHLQTITKTCAKFQNDRYKIV